MKTANKLTELDAIRGFAALYVVIHHARPAANSGWGSLLYFGQEAVMLFFLLSGFVIQYSVSSPKRRALAVKTYLIHRFRRIYPLLLFALLAAYVGASIEAGAFAEAHWLNLLQNTLMLQDEPGLKRGSWFVAYQGDSPLWSLSYEWWFYMLFIPLGLRWSSQELQADLLVGALAVAGALSYQVFPNQISLFVGYFVIWWAGVSLAREYRATGNVTFTGQRVPLAMLTLCTMLWIIPVIQALHAHVPIRPGVDPVLQARHFAFATLVECIGLLWRKAKLWGFGWTFLPFKLFAPISYSLYLLHMPFLRAAEGLGVTSAWIRLAVVVIALVPVCYLLEVRLQPLINRWTDSILRAPRGVAHLPPPAPG